MNCTLHRLLFSFAFLTLAVRAGAEPFWELEKEGIKNGIADYQGWCLPEKADLILELIHVQKPQICVDIGTFGGATFSVIAKAIRLNRTGVAFAIDPWSNEKEIHGFNLGSRLNDWWSIVKFDKIHDQFLSQLKEDRLWDLCEVCRMTSAEALSQFLDNSIDFLHIDGNHTENGFFFDAYHYYPKVKENGYILLNDANWTSARKAVIYLLENCELCTHYHESMPYLLFRKTSEVKRIADQLWR